MNRRLRKSLNARLSRRGTTLVEVLAGLVVLGTLLVAVAVARGRFVRQWSQADRKLAAVRYADAQVGRWLAGPPDAVPIDAAGPVDAPRDCVWRTRLIHDERGGGAGGGRRPVRNRGSHAQRGVLVRVDFPASRAARRSRMEAP
jgi:type II secretory pathway pseudopilin PulG